MRLPERIRRVFRIERFRPDPDSEVDDELAFHFDHAVRELVGRGMAPNEAEREVRRRFGDVRRYRRELEAMERTATGGWMREMRDRVGSVAETIMFALRGIRRSPGVAMAVITTLALGLGVNVAMFRVVDRLFLSPPEQIREASRVRVLYIAFDTPAGLETRFSTSFLNFRDLQGVGGFASVAAHNSVEMVVGEGTDAELMTVKVASGDFFTVLGASAVLGRFFGSEDDRVDAEPTAVLSWEFWNGAHGRDPDVLGRTMRIGSERYTVIGVAPRGFTGADFTPVDLWVPLEVYASIEQVGAWRESRGFNWLQLVARLAPGVSEAVAMEEATVVYRAAPGRSARRAERFVASSSLIQADRPDAGGEIAVARWLGAVSLIVLLIACANVANLLLTRNIRRRRELAVRAALGIGRRRLMTQLMTEAGILAVAGGLAGLALAGWVGGAMYRVLLPDLAFSESMLDPRILAFSGISVAFVTLLAGVLPAIQSSRPDLVASLKSGGEHAGTRRTATQVGLLVFQVTLSVVLLTGASVFVRSLTNLRAIDLGFETDGLAFIRLHIDGAQGAFAFLEEPDDGPAWPPNEIARISELVQERLSAVPGVRGAALVHPTPFLWGLTIPFHVPGLDSIPSTPSGGPFPLAVSPEYLELMDLELVAGRDFESEDDRFGAQPVTILNETMAALLWPDEGALGRCVMPGGEDHPCATVIGIVEDSHRDAVIEDDPQMIYYVPIRQQILGGAPENIFVRTDGANFASIRVAAQSASPLVRFAQVAPFSEVLGYELRPWTLGAAVFSAFGLLALLVAALGLYAVIAFDVAGRRHELGIRSALGATRHGLFGLVVRDVALLSGGGIALGFLVVAAVRRWIDPLLYETSALDLRILMPVGLLLASVALVAGSVPGSRAARADPIDVLRAE